MGELAENVELSPLGKTASINRGADPGNPIYQLLVKTLTVIAAPARLEATDIAGSSPITILIAPG